MQGIDGKSSVDALVAATGVAAEPASAAEAAAVVAGGAALVGFDPRVDDQRPPAAVDAEIRVDWVSWANKRNLRQLARVREHGLPEEA